MTRLHRLLKFVGLFSLVVLLCWSCGNNVSAPSSASSTVNMPTSPNCRTIEHDAGQTEICGQPQKVVALSPYILDMMLSLGEEPVGYSAADLEPAMLGQPEFDRPEEQIPFLGALMTGTPVNIGDRKSPSLEALINLKPDLIIGEAWQDKQGTYELFSQIAPTILLDDEKIGWTRTLPIVAKAFNKEAQQKEILATYEARTEAARQQLLPITQKYPKALVISSGDFSSAIYPYDNSVFSRLLEALGFQLVSAENIAGNAAQFSIEALIGFDTDLVMVVAWDTDDNSTESWKKRQIEWAETPLLQRMPASQAGQVYFIDGRLSVFRGPLAANKILEDYLAHLEPLN